MVSRHSLKRRWDAVLDKVHLLQRGQGPTMLPISASIIVPFGYDVNVHPRRVAVIAHIFYPELTVTLRDFVVNIPGEVDLLITTDTIEKLNDIKYFLQDWAVGKIRIETVPNRGRDWYGKIITYGDAYKDYDLLLFVHSKKSPYEHLSGPADIGQRWREAMLGSLAGSRAAVESIFALFDLEPSLGLVFPQHPPEIRHSLGWGANQRLAERLARSMGVDIDKVRGLDFPAGSMFWARPAAFQKLVELGIKDFPPEIGLMDGSLAHALERLPVFAAEAAGMKSLKVGLPELYLQSDPFLSVSTKAEINEAFNKAVLNLVGE